jgi:hypothetical protein
MIDQLEHDGSNSDTPLLQIAPNWSFSQESVNIPTRNVPSHDIVCRLLGHDDKRRGFRADRVARKRERSVERMVGRYSGGKRRFLMTMMQQPLGTFRRWLAESRIALADRSFTG